MHTATGRSLSLEIVAENVIKLSMKSYNDMKFFISCRLKTFHFSMFHLPSTFGDWSKWFFSTINLFHDL